MRIIGLVDPRLPPLLEEAKVTLDGTLTNAYAVSVEGPSPQPVRAFVSLSPMTHTPLFVGRLLADSRLLRTAVIYDFIPRRHPDRYLRDSRERLNYSTALKWLSRYDTFAPLSRVAADDLLTILPGSANVATITGAPLAPMFEHSLNGSTAAPKRHLLVVGGGDPRKNPEVAIRAHALSRAMQRSAGMPLLIVGNYGSADAEAFGNLAASLGGRSDLVLVTGHVSEADLVTMYSEALAVVCPSRDEGFSLPVVEGMAAGALCIASDIPAHRELLHDSAFRFEPDNTGRLVQLLNRLCEDPEWRNSGLAAQAAVWPNYRAHLVADRFWSSIVPQLQSTRTRQSAPAVLSGRRPRLALLSPVPPDRSGVADYTAATCVELGRHVELYVFTETTQPANLPNVVSTRPLSALPCLLPRFDRVLSVMGHSELHLRIFELLRAYGGACIAHDARMLGFYRSCLGQDRAIAVASKELHRDVTVAELASWLNDEGTLEALLLGEIAESAAPTVVHSSITARMIRERYGITPCCLPFSVYRTWDAKDLSASSRAAARARLGIIAGEIVIASFGLVHAVKAPEKCIMALAILHSLGIPASLHFVGELHQTLHAPLAELCRALGLIQHVRVISGYVPEAVYRDYLAGANLGMQLRTYSLGGLSGALLDCAAAGLPTVTNASLGLAVTVPEGFFRCVPDDLDPALLAAASAELLEFEHGSARVDEQRRAFSLNRSFAVYARDLCGALGLQLPTFDGLPV